ncbi:MAG: DUF3604 domain-containing protein [Myxococcota bacterium]
MKRVVLLGLLLALALFVAWIVAAGSGRFGSHESPGEPVAAPRPAAVVSRTAAAVAEGAAGIGARRDKQILFGDLHVHTTVSFDAFMMSLPLGGGEGSHPQADACDFARYCSALDFWSINDHAEGITERNWSETVDAIRQCNDVAGDPESPDTVAFLGWEWTQVGGTPDEHWGHKNVVLAHTDDERIPARPIAAAATARVTTGRNPGLLARAALSFLGRGDARTQDLVTYFAERAGWEFCPDGVDTRELPRDCLEVAETPGDLFRKLREWGHDALVIPHGTTWGMYTPPTSSWDKQLSRDQHDAGLQRLVEVYSGHGDSEVYRDWAGVEYDADGTPVCPEPSRNYLPSCWRAGEIIRERCLAEGTPAAECDAREVEARSLAAAALLQAHLTVPGAGPEEWLDAGQCLDCDEPAFNYRPRGSAQFMLAHRNFDEAGEPLRFRFGFMASSDNHFARPGTGYKEVHRRGFTESRFRGRGPLADILASPPVEPSAHPVAFDRENTDLFGFQLFEVERQSSFFTTGGLIAAHAEGRDRGSIWDAMQRREVYGTSGPRILLWFDLLNPAGAGSRGATLPMGSSTELSDVPIFQARAVGSFEQKPGCPDHASQALGEERLETVCKGECYHPSDRRRLITRIEVVRIRPQDRAGEDLASLIDDPWRSFACDPDPAGCAVTFTDPEFASAGRDAVYYVRAYEQSAPGVNADNLRCTYGADGRCVAVDLCDGTRETEGDCLGEHEPRAWSSPIFVDHAGAGRG